MTTTPLPPPVPLTGLDCYIDPKDGKVKRYDQARADLEAEVQRFKDHLTKQNAELDELIPMAQKLEAENKRLREALQVLVDNGGIGPEWMFDDARTALKGTK